MDVKLVSSNDGDNSKWIHQDYMVDGKELSVAVMVNYSTILQSWEVLMVQLNDGVEHFSPNQRIELENIITEKMNFQVEEDCDGFTTETYKKTRPRIAIDLDGVCANFSDAFLSYLNTYFNKNIRKEQLTKWDWLEVDGVDITKEEWDRCFESFTKHRMWQALEVLPHAKEALCTLADNGCELFYLTDRPEQSRRATLKFIVKNGFPFDGILFTGDKAPLAKSLGIDVAVDDKESTIKSYRDIGIKAFLMDKPFNSMTIDLVNNMRDFCHKTLDYIREQSH